MASSTNVVVTGIKSIDRRLHQLAPRIQKKVVRQAVRKGLHVIAAEVKAQAPTDTGATRKGVKVRALKSRKRGSISLECRIAATSDLKRTSAKTGKTWFYPALIEYLHRKYMKIAFKSKGRRARQVMIDGIRAGIEREVRRLAP